MKKKDTVVLDKAVDYIARPIIVMDPGWELPVMLREMITVQRLAASVSGEEIATEAEAMAYISNASMAAPLSHDWVAIYQYLFTRNYNGAIPDELKQDTISNYQQQMLGQLRSWIYTKGIKHVKEAKRNARKSEQEGVAGGLEASATCVR